MDAEVGQVVGKQVWDRIGVSLGCKESCLTKHPQGQIELADVVDLEIQRRGPGCLRGEI